MYTPPFIVFDFETEENGKASTEYYRPDFLITSAAFAWLDSKGFWKTAYFDGPGAEEKIGRFLERCLKQGTILVVHNFQFEFGCITCRFPHLLPLLEKTFVADTMRLVQNYDNGGGEFQFMPLTYEDQLDFYLSELDTTDSDAPKKGTPKQKYIGGLSLKNAAMRLLGIDDPKQRAHEWLRENVEGCRRGNEGEFLSFLPDDYMKDYNIGDVITPGRLYLFITEEFDKINFDWRVDHGLYRSTLERIVASKIEGVEIKRAELTASISQVRDELSAIELGFARTFASEIRSIERDRLLGRIHKLKTFRGKKAYLRRLRANDSQLFANEIQFNVGSNKQLEALFVGKLRLEPKFRTEKGSPAFRSSVLGQWGSGGEILKTRRRRLLVLKQCEALLALSEFDGKWHMDIKCCGTATGRMAGGSV